VFKKQKIVSVIFVLIVLLCANLALASESTSFQTNDENLSFGHNEGYMESTTFALDLSGITWTERFAESTSYTVIDANSDIDLAPPVTPPSPGGGGGSGPGGGTAPVIGDNDIPYIASIPTQDELELNQPLEEEEEVLEEEEEEMQIVEPQEILHPSAEEIEQMIEEDKNVFIFTEAEPILHYPLDEPYDEYEFVQMMEYEIEPLTIDVPEEVLESVEGEVTVEGDTGAGYQVVALWINDDYMNQSYSTANEAGEFEVRTPDSLPDGKYLVLVYGLQKEGKKIVQTNYETVKFEVVDGKAYVKYVLEEVKKPCFRFDLFAIYIIIVLISLYSLWKRKN